MEENVANPLILGRPFLATSRALIDMESGELMLRIHDECLVLQVYKAMHQSPCASISCMKVEEVDQVNTSPLDKKPKKKSKEDKGKSIDYGEFQQLQKTFNVPYPPEIMKNNDRASSKMSATTTLSHNKNNLSVKLSDDKQALDGRQPIQYILFLGLGFIVEEIEKRNCREVLFCYLQEKNNKTQPPTTPSMSTPRPLPYLGVAWMWPPPPTRNPPTSHLTTPRRGPTVATSKHPHDPLSRHTHTHIHA
ncbi:hypothetical protein PIB30_097653 [Stylosanthes scabra]|uniref:Galectin domain-containing protein n=1 Tax=Stylosanthes scabra TaxID=79078 RepID=A0ABU6TXW5_9FABA|nr:hypothetical protein [Stylosanthes scabra]